jgi:diguanylate cyclase (GGDEF)-like protein
MGTLFTLYCLHNVYGLVVYIMQPRLRFYHIWIDRTIIAGLSFGYLLMSSARLRNKFENQANTDHLTGALNRRAMEREAQKLKTRRPQCVAGLMLDLDDFKGINDTHGHYAGDLALRALADCLRETMRTGDLVARLGGDEFLVIMAGTNSEEAEIAATRLHRRIDAIRVPSELGPFAIHASIGVTSFDHQEFRLEDLIRMGDRALYAAKVDKRSEHNQPRGRDFASFEGEFSREAPQLQSPQFQTQQAETHQLQASR